MARILENPHKQKLLGQILIEESLISPDTLDSMLLLQSKNPKLPLGKLLLINNILQKEQLESALLLQQIDMINNCNDKVLKSGHALYSLSFYQPKYSAKNINYFRFVLMFGICMICSMGFATIIFFNNLLYLMQTIFKMIVTTASFKKTTNHSSDESLLNQNDLSLPIYSIFIPLYKESNMIKQILQVIDSLNYPKNKLDVKFIVEESDTETIVAITEQDLPRYIQVIQVPYSIPQTKPKAMNYALPDATGEFLTVYDAEDIPDPNQLLNVIKEFRNSPESYACIQCLLDFHNENTNILTKLFSFEYKLWFGYLIKGLSNMNLPITLGGSSNHFKTNILRQLGGWDPYNVTEDADLGIRLFCKGYNVKLINSTTLEESLLNIKSWFKQRSRWIKGFIVTYLVYILNTKNHSLKKRGAYQSIVPHLFLGISTYNFLILPINLIGSVLLPKSYIIEQIYMLNLYIHIIYCYSILFIIYLKNKDSILKYTIINLVAILLWPVYFFMHSIAAYIALYELLFCPFNWQKTTHGATLYKFNNIKNVK